MQVSSHTAPDGTVTIKISGRFDFKLQQDLRKAYESQPRAPRYVIDLAGTEYMDSAACGMLLVFRDFAGGDKAEITLANANQEIKKTLNMLQFHKLFRVP